MRTARVPALHERPYEENVTAGEGGGWPCARKVLDPSSMTATGDKGRRRTMDGDPELVGGLVGRCIDAATASVESVERWRRQRRTLDRLPSYLADALLRRIIQRRILLYPSWLEYVLS
ncbi:hypothetical protein B296_00000996 [Ensete ventricosum]|uniref:Uncharacterized protein n=1 Tax=Ensete ventricosum TaxID=4639 RepID=A0A427B9K8_ENSVE|nr:hypothetical protein B296_00000996 [Ensete ventricosum]